MKKGLLFSQPFIYIFMIIVIAIVLIVGINIVRKTWKTAERIEIEDFIGDLSGEIERNYHFDYGSASSLEDLSVPSTIKQICFVDRSRGEEVSGLDEKVRQYIVLFQSDNVFLVPKEEKEEIYIENINYFRLDIDTENPLCLSTLDSKLNVRLVNKGSYVALEKVI